MTTVTFKGLVKVAGGLLAVGTATVLWFEVGQTHLPTSPVANRAEVCAGAVESASMLAGGPGTATVWTITEYTTYDSVTNAWGGYASFAIGSNLKRVSDGTMFLRTSGTYDFDSRNYRFVARDDDSGRYYSGVCDFYTNRDSAKRSWLLDMGPSSGWLYSFQSFGTRPTPGGIAMLVCRAFTNLEERYVTTAQSYPAFSRVMNYSPRTNITYINTIGLFDELKVWQTVTDKIRLNGVATYPGVAPCFIGPTNVDMDYDGVTEFPRVATNTWFTNYLRVGRDYGWTNQLMVTTNALNLHYAAQYRLRDQQAAATGGVVDGGYWQGFADRRFEFFPGTNDLMTAYQEMYDDIVTAWNSGAPSTGTGTGNTSIGGVCSATYYKHYVPNYIELYMWVKVCTGKFSTVSTVWTNTPRVSEFYVLGSYPDNSFPPIHLHVQPTVYTNWGTGIETNVYHLVSPGIGPTVLIATSSVVSAWVLPTFGDFRIDPILQYYEDNPGSSDFFIGSEMSGWFNPTEIYRWHRNTCSNAALDALMNPP